MYIRNAITLTLY